MFHWRFSWFSFSSVEIINQCLLVFKSLDLSESKLFLVKLLWFIKHTVIKVIPSKSYSLKLLCSHLIFKYFIKHILNSFLKPVTVKFLNILFAGDLMFHLNRILFSPHLQTIITWEVSLFIIIKFLSKLINFLHSTGLCHNTDISCVKYFKKCLLKDFCDYKTKEILVRVQQEFISIWMCILLWCCKWLLFRMNVKLETVN